MSRECQDPYKLYITLVYLEKVYLNCSPDNVIFPSLMLNSFSLWIYMIFLPKTNQPYVSTIFMTVTNVILMTLTVVLNTGDLLDPTDSVVHCVPMQMTGRGVLSIGL